MGSRIGYARVSTVDQHLDRQRIALADARTSRVFEDAASGADLDRPGLRDALAYLREGDVLVVSSLDRLARSVRDLVGIVEEITERGAALEVLSPALRLGAGADPAARLQMHVLAAVAEMERAIIRERQREGIEAARDRNVYAGRARALDAGTIRTARERRADGVPLVQIARDLGVSRQTLRTALAGRGAYETVGEQ